jgi:hypothetical protein
MAEGVLRFRANTSALLAERGTRIAVTTMAASIAPWPVLFACLRASGLTQAQVSWQASLAAFAMVRLVTVLPVTQGASVSSISASPRPSRWALRRGRHRRRRATPS